MSGAHTRGDLERTLEAFPSHNPQKGVKGCLLSAAGTEALVSGFWGI